MSNSPFLAPFCNRVSLKNCHRNTTISLLNPVLKSDFFTTNLKDFKQNGHSFIYVYFSWAEPTNESRAIPYPSFEMGKLRSLQNCSEQSRRLEKVHWIWMELVGVCVSMEWLVGGKDMNKAFHFPF